MYSSIFPSEKKIVWVYVCFIIIINQLQDGIAA